MSWQAAPKAMARPTESEATCDQLVHVCRRGKRQSRSTPQSTRNKIRGMAMSLKLIYICKGMVVCTPLSLQITVSKFPSILSSP
mmetsp:Transcript_60030/g.105545  ORF Transcript_60030/g.105545 Transcript_60030/m.105545 type:complete len:84 (-) Transcript_60030:76-327(-)